MTPEFVVTTIRTWAQHMVKLTEQDTGLGPSSTSVFPEQSKNAPGRMRTDKELAVVEYPCDTVQFVTVT